MTPEPAVYSIGAVSETTGVPMSTLRYWERAHGLVIPRRTTGGHRLYTPTDVKRIFWLKRALIEGGLKAGAAHALLREHPEYLERDPVEVVGLEPESEPGDRDRPPILESRPAALRELLELAALASAPTEVADRALSFMTDRLGVDVLTLWEATEDGTRLMLAGSAGLPAEFATDYAEGVSVDADYAVSFAFREGRPVTLGSLSGERTVPDFGRAAYDRYGVAVSSILVLPVGPRPGHRTGATTLGWRDPCHITEDDIAFFGAAINAVAMARENVRLARAESVARLEVTAQFEKTALLLEAANSVAETADLRSALDRLARLLLRSVPHDRTVMYAHDERADDLEVLAAAGHPVPKVGTRMPLSSMTPAARDIILSGRTGVIDFDELPDVHRGRGEQSGVHLLLAVPLMHREKTVGAIVLDDSTDPRMPFGAGDIGVLEAFAAQAAVVIENARLLEVERASARLAEARAEVDRVVLSSLEFEEIAASALAQGAKAIGAETGAIIGREGDGWLTWSSYGFTPSVAGVALTDAENPHGVMALKTRKPIAVDDAYNDPRVDSDFMKGYGLRSVVVAPIEMRGEAVAGLYYNYNSAAHHFTLQEIQFVTKVAASLSLALENARLVEDLRATTDRVSTILDSIRDAFFALDREWRFTFVNREAERVLRAPETDLLGRVIWEALPDFADAAHQDELRAVMGQREMAVFKEHYPSLGLWADVRAYPSADGISVYMHDIGEEKTAEAAIEEAQHAQQLRAAITSAVSTVFERAFHCEDVDEFYAGCLELACQATESPFGFIGEMSEDGLMYDIAISNPGWSECATLPASSHSSGQGFPVTGLYGRVLMSGETLLTNEPARHPDSTGTPEGHPPLTAFLGVPLMWEGAVAGMIGVANRRDGYGEDEATLLESVAPALIEAVQRKRAETALAESRKRGVLLATLLDESSQPFMVGRPDGSLHMFNRAWEQLVGRSAEELSDARWPDDVTAPEYVKMEKAVLAQVARTGLPARYEKEILRPDGTRIPVDVLRHADLDEAGNVRYFYAFFTDITERREAERLNEALNEISALVGASLDREQILDTLLDRGAAALGSDGGALVIRSDDGWAIQATVGEGVLPAGTSIADFGVAPTELDRPEYRPTVVDDTADSDQPFAAALEATGIRSVLAMPILAAGAVIGYAAFVHTSRAVKSSRAQREFAERLMMVVTLALENARLYEQQLHIATTLQRAVLAPTDEVPGLETSYLYRPASSAADVGGDYYDLFRIDAQRVAAVIGDVSGKGVEAARMTTLMRDGLRAYAYMNPDPVWVLGHLNELVKRSTPPDLFSTVFFAVMNTETGELRYSGAAHPPAIILRREGAAEPLPSRGTIVGAFEHARFAVDSVTLNAGDILLACTDGVTEARSGLELFGDERLLETVRNLHGTPLQDLPDALLDRVLEFSAGVLRDDCVIFCLRRVS